MSSVINGKEKFDINISGQSVVTTVSGDWIDVSGATVIAKVSGEVVQVSGESVFVYISGGVIASDVSGNWVDVSGATVIAKISGETVVTSISGESVFVYISGGSITTAPSISPVWTTATSSGVLDLTTPAAQEAYLDYVEYHGASACTISSAGVEFTVDHKTVEGYTFNVFAVDMGANTVKDLVYYPDTPTVLVSGDAVEVKFTNPEGIVWTSRIMTRR